jgi:hypothetical protein
MSTWGPDPDPTTQTDQQPPPPPPKPKRQRQFLISKITVGVTAGITLFIVCMLVVAAMLISGHSPQVRATSTTAASGFAPPASAPSDQSFPDEGITQTTKPEVSHKKVGETGTLFDPETGTDLERVSVDRVKFAGGDEFNKPERGLWLGVHVKTRALADGQSSLWGDIYVVISGHHYDGDGCCPDGFTPALDYVDLNEGETAEGWLVFDVPARHGEVVLKDSMSDVKLGTWTF